MAAEGARVVIGDVVEAGGAAVADELGAGARFAALAVTDEGSWRAAVADNAVAPASGCTASKWGLRGLTEAAAIEFGPDRIRVNINVGH